MNHVKPMVYEAKTLYGISLKHSLKEDQTEHLVDAMKAYVKQYAEPNYLIQIYISDDFTENTDFITFVGSDQSGHSDLNVLNIPKGEYLVFEHLGDESEIDLTHAEIQQYLKSQPITVTSNFDFEKWEPSTGKIFVFIPLDTAVIEAPDTIDKVQLLDIP
ncbi:Predicted transcriptional regulator YdeE, contains AraC-type DNA-binding domain [Paenibacillus tianmuensis]|uniref:Predicted transcriptional regulator YdeE, contains AraC-type DNA-binding domain n=1 Tax=Paenibacillus tianmuensis TaxID=624147 RepID=A0A1G4S6X9_9BACL|nr:GyrI-like domain-containing protein [Paenibacillus tianmuensis]SCW64850.1 Predicted transcriptional regulator YdeE, contains AraC-type DNA-binding domain [Paenibacillus tianmuensis]